MINNKNIWTNKISLVNGEDDSHENTIRSIMDAMWWSFDYNIYIIKMNNLLIIC